MDIASLAALAAAHSGRIPNGWTEDEWKHACAIIDAPFDVEDIEFRPLDNPKNAQGKTEANTKFLCYITARGAHRRLDQAFGKGGWSSIMIPLTTGVDPRTNTSVVTSMLAAIIVGGVIKMDAGDTGLKEQEQTKGSASSATKRALVPWSEGARLLYDLGDFWGVVRRTNVEKDYWFVPDETIKALRALYPQRLQAAISGQPIMPTIEDAPDAPPAPTRRQDVGVTHNPAPARPDYRPSPRPPQERYGTEQLGGDAMPRANGNGSPTYNGPAPHELKGELTEKQLKAIYSIARATQRLAEADVDKLCAANYGGRRPEDLSKAEASAFIDHIKALQPA